MSKFDTHVVRTDCLSGLEKLGSHPNVKNVILLPRDWVLYEFHHELFNDPDFLGATWHRKMQEFPALKHARMEMLREERALREPWYKNKGNKFGDSAARLGTEISQYHICTLGKAAWVPLKVVPGWGCAQEFVLRLCSSKETDFLVFLKLLEEMLEAGKAQCLRLVSREQTKDALTVAMSSSVVSGHWIAAFWVLAGDGRWKSEIKEIVDLSKIEQGAGPASTRS